MLLSELQIERLKEDLDYIVPRTRCDTLPLTRGHIANAIDRDPDVLLDLIDGMPSGDARWLSVPIEILRPLIERRRRGVSGGSASSGQSTLPGV